MTNCHAEILAKLQTLYGELIAHDGFGELRIEVRLLRRGQKEIIIHCGKQYRYVVDDVVDDAVPERQDATGIGPPAS
jgi:hypothetical protein